MRARTFVTIVVALTLGAFAVFLARIWLQSQIPEAVARRSGDGNLSRVVVATVPLRFGVKLSSQNLTEMAWPADAIPPGAFTSKTELISGKPRAVLSPIEKNEPVLKWKITGPGQRASLSALISNPEMKAVTIRVDVVRGVAGFVLPGDRVDVLLTRTERAASKKRLRYTDVLLQNVAVLAVDQTADERTEKPKLAKAVTLEVDTLSAQKLALAESAGKLSLVLRRAGATTAGGNRRVTLGDLGQTTIAAPADEKAADVKAIEIHALINVVRGINRQEVSVPK